MIDLRVTGKYSRMPQGLHQATIRSYDGWYQAAEDTMGRLIIDRPGQWRLYTEQWSEDEGSSMIARATLDVSETGVWALKGDPVFIVEDK